MFLSIFELHLMEYIDEYNNVVEIDPYQLKTRLRENDPLLNRGRIDFNRIESEYTVDIILAMITYGTKNKTNWHINYGYIMDIYVDSLLSIDKSYISLVNYQATPLIIDRIAKMIKNANHLVLINCGLNDQTILPILKAIKQNPSIISEIV